MYTIYHVKGIKVGCTKDINRRTRQLKRQFGDDIEIEILQELEDSVGDEGAGDVEWIWAEGLGYPTGTHYQPSRDNLSHTRSELGSIGGSIGGKVSNPYKGYGTRRDLAGISYLTTEQYQEHGRKGGKKGFIAQWEKGKNPFQNREIQRELSLRSAAQGKGGMKKIVECPHCGKSSTAAIMGRWHFDNCRNKKLSLDADSKTVVTTNNSGQSP